MAGVGVAGRVHCPNAGIRASVDPVFFCIVLLWGFGPRWDFKLLMLAFSLGSLLAGTLAARRVRFPLVAGGFIIVIVALILPQGV